MQLDQAGAFLADRTALLTQAGNAFKEHLPHSSPVNITKIKDDTTSRIVLSTYPTMMNCIDEAKGGNKRFSPGHFDLIGGNSAGSGLTY